MTVETKNITSKFNAVRFFKQVRQEISKVVWPSRKETSVTTVMVFIMGLMATIYFAVVDGLLSWLIRQILGWGA